MEAQEIDLRVEEAGTEGDAVWVTKLETGGRPGLRRRLLIGGLAQPGLNPAMYDWGNDGGAYCDRTRQQIIYKRIRLWIGRKREDESEEATLVGDVWDVEADEGWE